MNEENEKERRDNIILPTVRQMNEITKNKVWGQLKGNKLNRNSTKDENGKCYWTR